MSKTGRGIFITGTDTGIGKTVVSALFAIAAKKEGLKAAVMKPVASGSIIDGGIHVSPDVLFFRKVLGQDIPDCIINPILLETPLAPMVAAELEETTIDLAPVWKSYDKLIKQNDIVIVEGIGGLLVPITEIFMAGDIAASLSLPVAVVARPALGTLNHTLLTLESARKRELEVISIILNHTKSGEPDLAERTNLGALKKLSCVPHVFEQAFIPEPEFDALEKHVTPDYMEILRQIL